MLRLIAFANHFGLPIFAAILLLLAAFGPITAWAGTVYLTVTECGVDPLRDGEKVPT